MNDMMLLVEPLIPQLRRYARMLTGNPAAADDLVQDCLERVITRWHQRRPDGDTRSWVFTILHNLAVNTMRQRSRRGPHAPIDDMDESAFAQLPAQQDALLHRDLLAGLDKLPAEQRHVLLLVAVEDLSYADAARVLDIPIGTVMSRLARAREKLAAWMEEGNMQSIRTAKTPNVHLRRIK